MCARILGRVPPWRRGRVTGNIPGHVFIDAKFKLENPLVLHFECSKLESFPIVLLWTDFWPFWNEIGNCYTSIFSLVRFEALVPSKLSQPSLTKWLWTLVDLKAKPSMLFPCGQSNALRNIRKSVILHKEKHKEISDQFQRENPCNSQNLERVCLQHRKFSQNFHAEMWRNGSSVWLRGF